MKTPHLIITIGRQFGSGGRELGHLISKELGIAYYDKELITAASNESGLDPECFESADEHPPYNFISTLASSLTMSGSAFGSKNILAGENIFKLQADSIRDVANSGPCVVVGRCADYILRDKPLCISIFITASEQDRIDRIISHHGAVSAKQALDMMQKADKRRANYYNFYTDKTWGVASSYNLCIDSSTLGIKSTAEAIRCYVEQRIDTCQS